MRTSSKKRVASRIADLRAVLRARMEADGVPITAVAACAGVTPSTLAHWLAGRQPSMPLPTLLRVLDALELQVVLTQAQ